MIFSIGFLLKSGTEALAAGQPTGSNKNALSFCGRFNIFAKKFIGLGVYVNAPNPALYIAVISNPHAIPTDSFTK